MRASIVSKGGEQALVQAKPADEQASRQAIFYHFF